MKAKVIAIVFGVMSLCVTEANAFKIPIKIPIPVLYGNDDEITLVKKLPDTDMFTFETSDGRKCHVDLGVMHKQFSLYYVPLVNYGECKYVLFSKTEGIYALSENDIEALRTMFDDIPNEPKLPIWRYLAIGGKVIFSIILFLYVLKWTKRMRKAKACCEEPTNNEQVL